MPTQAQTEARRRCDAKVELIAIRCDKEKGGREKLNNYCQQRGMSVQSYIKDLIWLDSNISL